MWDVTFDEPMKTTKKQKLKNERKQERRLKKNGYFGLGKKMWERAKNVRRLMIDKRLAYWLCFERSLFCAILGGAIFIRIEANFYRTTKNERDAIYYPTTYYFDWKKKQIINLKFGKNFDYHHMSNI